MLFSADSLTDDLSDSINEQPVDKIITAINDMSADIRLIFIFELHSIYFFNRLRKPSFSFTYSFYKTLYLSDCRELTMKTHLNALYIKLVKM